jgi:hypothetical protein
MLSETELILYCRKLIETELSWGLSDRWSNQDFERLSGMIMERTQAKLSVSTLKRIWGKVRYDSLPTVTTLNVMANYVGYTSWRDFVAANSHHAEPVTSPMSKDRPIKPWWVQYPITRRIVFMLVLILLGIIAGLIFRS